MKKRKSKVRVIYQKQKIIQPKPDCPKCKHGILESREYVTAATEESDEQRAMVLYCPACEWIF